MKAWPVFHVRTGAVSGLDTAQSRQTEQDKRNTLCGWIPVKGLQGIMLHDDLLFFVDAATAASAASLPLVTCESTLPPAPPCFLAFIHVYEKSVFAQVRMNAMIFHPLLCR